MTQCERLGCNNETKVYGCNYCPDCADRYRLKCYKIQPLGKPRMTQRDKWAKRPAVLRYRAFKDECKLNRVELPESGAGVTFVIPMPDSWSRKKKVEMMGKPHKQKPDLDNLAKALMDAVHDDDAGIWDIRMAKVWGLEGQIRIEYPLETKAA